MTPFNLSIHGYCPICEGESTFKANHEWLRDSLQCEKCSSIPRERALAYVVGQFFPQWRECCVHESSPMLRGFSLKLQNECKEYIASHYWRELDLGSSVGVFLNQDLEKQTFADGKFDLVISQDVMEHINRPDVAFREVARTLKVGGAYVFSAPPIKTWWLHKGLVST